MPYTSSDISRFPVMLLSPILSESGKTGRLEVICLELRPPPGAIYSVRTMAHTFASRRSSVLRCVVTHTHREIFILFPGFRMMAMSM
jgi:hypothetical protein